VIELPCEMIGACIERLRRKRESDFIGTDDT
jgi:hypothetical protein